MKKLFVATAVFVTGFVASAASFNWSAANDAFSPDGENPLEGKAYFFDASSYALATISAGLESTGTSVLSSALGSTTLVEGAIEGLAGTGFSYEGDAPASLSAYIIVLSTDEKNYWASDTVYVTVTDAIKGGQQAMFNFGEVMNATWTGTVANVPEPTSGLLILLGMAGLALRRKRA